jgi:hypothetical protein
LPLGYKPMLDYNAGFPVETNHNEKDHVKNLSPGRFRLLVATLLFVLSGYATAAFAQANKIDDLQRGFQHPPDDARIMMRWWWFGPAVTKPELEREMRLMKEGGIGGFEVQAVYPLVLDDSAAGIKTLPFLSDEFLDALKFTSQKARELGLRMDLTLGSGWPFGGPQVPIGQAAGRLRYEHVVVDAAARRVKVPAIGNGEKLMAVFLARPQAQGFVPDSLRPITDIVNGVVQIPAGLEAPTEVLFFISSRNGMQVKRPAVGAEGFVLDHLDRAAIDNYLKQVGDRLMQAFGSQPPHAIFCDSLEAYNNDWTGNLLAEFKQRRGYDLTPYLPALVGDIGPRTAGIRHDWGMTLTELLNEHFLGPLRDWSKRNHVLFRVQDYGVPAAALSSNAYADLPEGEGAQWKTLSSTRWASSASHQYGHNVTSSETWTWLHSPVFRATPLDMKAEADRHFLQGINQLIGHGWPYTPPGIEYPGFRFYAAAVFDEKNPWWLVMPDVTAYMQRLSFLLRQGEPANDVAIYLPNDDAWAHFSANNVSLIEGLRQRLGANVIPQVLDSGHNFDAFDDATLKQVGRVDNGALVLGGHKYRAVIMPSVESIPLETYTKLAEFARGGGVLMATGGTPTTSPGGKTSANDHQKILAISQSLFKDPSAAGHLVADETKLGSALAGLLRPDVAISPAAPDVGFIHRHTEDGEIYFLANTSNETLRLSATFNLQGMKPEWWNPFKGSVTPAEVAAQPAGGTTVQLVLEPYESKVLVFTRRSLPLTQPVGPSQSSLDLSLGWNVSFGNEPGAMMERLRSWTENPETRYFSGLATYEKEANVPQALLQNQSVRMDFGPGQALPVLQSKAGMQTWFDPPVREAAVLYINDKRAGSLWCPPYSVDVTGLLRPGSNKIRVVVANTALNYMAGHSLPDYRLLNLRYGERFQAQDMDKVQALPSGLLGPIRLTTTPR